MAHTPHPVYTIRMRAIASIFIIFGFIAMAVFGALVMNHSMMQYVGCVAPSNAVIPCPMNQISLFLHHAAAIQLFFTAIPISHGVIMLFALLSALVVFLQFTPDSLRQPLARYSRTRTRALCPHSARKFTHWLSLFELSPSL